MPAAGAGCCCSLWTAFFVWQNEWVDQKCTEERLLVACDIFCQLRLPNSLETVLLLFNNKLCLTTSTMAKVRLSSNILEPFSGEGDVVAWLKKVRLVTRLQLVDNVISLLPLYLERDALALYMEMKEEDQKDISLIKARLKEAFTDGTFTAYRKLTMVRWAGECIDVYMILLMAVLQQHKSKVRPVMDFWELNCYVDAFTANTDVCTDKLHEWWQKGSNVSLLDLKRAYLQVRVQKTLLLFQTLKIGGQWYCLTRLGFGINVAPFVMKAIVSTVLLQ